MWVALSACSPEHVAPVSGSEEPTIALHGYDTPWCGPVSVYNMVDDNGNTSPGNNAAYGELTVANHTDSIRFILNLSPGWFVDKAAVFAGNSSDIPVTQNGIIMTSLLPVQDDPSQYVNNCTQSWRVPSHNNQCYDVVYWCEVLELDFFNGPVQNSRRGLWAKQTSFANGFMIDYCYTTCPQSQGDDRFQ